MFEDRNASIQKATESVHQETVRIVDAQMEGMATQMEALDDFVTKARSQNGAQHEAYMSTFGELVNNVKESYTSMGGEFNGLDDRVHAFENMVTQQKDSINQSVVPFSEDVRQPLEELRKNIQGAPMSEYQPTGNTPPRTSYEYVQTLPQTEPHTSLIAKFKQGTQLLPASLEGDELAPLVSPSKSRLGSPSKTRVYNDAEDEVGESTTTAVTSSNTGLREVDINVAAKPLKSSNPLSSPEVSKIITIEKDDDSTLPPLKKQQTYSDSKLPQKALLPRRVPAGITLDGRENLPLGASTGRRLRNRQSTGLP